MFRLLHCWIPLGDKANFLRWLRVTENVYEWTHWLHRLRKCSLFYGNINLLWNQIAQPNAYKTPTPYPYGKFAFQPFWTWSSISSSFATLLVSDLCSFLFKVSLFSSILKSAQQQARVTEVEVFKTVLFSSRGRLTSARRLYKTAYFSRLSLVKLFVCRPHSRLLLWRFACAFFPERTNNTKKRKGDNG